MTPYEDLPEARNVGEPGTEFRAIVDLAAEYMHTFHLQIEGTTGLVTTYKDRRCMLVFAPLADGRLSVDIRTFTDDDLTSHAIHDAGMITSIIG